MKALIFLIIIGTLDLPSAFAIQDDIWIPDTKAARTPSSINPDKNMQNTKTKESAPKMPQEKDLDLLRSS